VKVPGRDPRLQDEANFPRPNNHRYSEVSLANCHFVHAACCTPIQDAPQGIFLHREPNVGDVVYWSRNKGKAVLVKQRTIIFDENDDVISVLFKVDELPAEEEEAITGVLAR
jgi:hypothetical protein